MVPEPADAERASSPTLTPAAGPEAWPQTRRIFGGRFEELDILGETDRGRVYRARDRERSGKEVAVEVLLARFSRLPGFSESFFREVKRAQSVGSERIVPVLEAGQIDDGRLYFAEELIEGESLRARLDREGALHLRAALEIARQTVLALDAGHQKGQVYGAIVPQNILLAARVPKTAANPEGIGVRLFPFGLGELFATADPAIARAAVLFRAPQLEQGRPATAQSDFFAVGLLLFEMVTGEPPDRAILSSRLNEFDASLAALIRRAIAAEPDQAFTSSEALVRAIESVRGYRETKRLPAWGVVLLSLIGLAALAAGMWALEQRSEAKELERQNEELAAENLAAARAQEEACQTQINEKEAEIGLFKRHIDELATQMQIAQEGGLVGGGRGQELDRLNVELGRAQEERQALRESLEELRRTSQELEARNARLLALSTVEGRRALALDRLLESISLGSSERAPVLVEEWARDGTLSTRDERTWSFLQSFAACAAETARLDQGDADPATLALAQSRLDEARGTRDGFLREARLWLEDPLGEKKPPERAARIDRALLELGRQVETAQESIRASHERDWRLLNAGGDVLSAEEVLEHVERFRCDHLREWTRVSGAEWIARFVVEGELDVEGLCDSPATARLAEGLSGLPAGDETTATLLALDVARRWYCGDADALALALEVPPIVAPSPEDDWAAELALSLALARPDAAPPMTDGRIAVYRDFDVRRGTSAWYIERRVARGESSTSAGEVERRVYVNDGLDPSGAPQRVAWSRRGRELLRAGRTVLDLSRHGDALAVVAWAGPTEPSVPQRSWFPHAEELARFLRDVSLAPAPCLVARDGEVERWFSPVFGLVREARAENFVFELVYVGPEP